MEDNKEEIWKDIVHPMIEEGLYQISNQGRVRKQEKTILNKLGVYQTRREKLLKTQVMKNTDYLYVTLLSKDGRHYIMYISRLVAEAFLPKPKAKELSCVGYKDGNRWNCTADNLYWKSLNDKINFLYGVPLNRSQKPWKLIRYKILKNK